MSKHRARNHTALTITELAVDPADVDEETYPVRLRLSRTLTPHEARALGEIVPQARVEPESVVLPEARLDDVAHAAEEWSRLLERAETLGGGMDGAADRVSSEAQDRMAEQHRDLSRDTSVQNNMH